MQIEFEHFDSERFSFHEHPVLVIENFFTNEERRYFQHAMQRAAWTPLREKRHLRETFRAVATIQEAVAAEWSQRTRR